MKHRIMSVNGKTSDCFSGSLQSNHSLEPLNGGYDLNDYVPDDIGIGGGDYVEFSYCLDCGMIQGDFPVLPDLGKWKKLED